jgi:hypothetical protein
MLTNLTLFLKCKTCEKTSTKIRTIVNLSLILGEGALGYHCTAAGFEKATGNCYNFLLVNEVRLMMTIFATLDCCMTTVIHQDR